MMWRIGARLKSVLIFVHRWMGVVLCLLFLLWFSSGIAMMYWDYPNVSAADRWAHSPALDASKIALSPEKAFTLLEANVPASGVRLRSLDGRPVYEFAFAGTSEKFLVFADNGEMPAAFSPEFTLRVASAWSGQPPGDAQVTINTEADQWTVAEQFADLRPLRKYTWPDGQQVYVSTVSGDVVQYTTRASRMGAYFGAIPHWVYFTQLRKRAQQWTSFVVWASGLATVAAILGITLGVWIYSPSKRYRYAGASSSIPYSGWKRWHMVLGLFFGLLACTWALSGMLSMDPFLELQGAAAFEAGARLNGALRGKRPELAAFNAKPVTEALAEAGSDPPVRELQFTTFAGEPAYLAIAAQNQSRVIPVLGEPAGAFDPGQIVEALKKGAQPATVTQVRLVTEYEAYYLDRHHRLPLPVIFVQLDDPGRSMYYVDPKTARIVEGYDWHSRWNRWLYHGLHSMDIPWLYRHRPAWDIVVLTLLLGGTSLCITSLLLTWGVLRRKLRAGYP